MFSKSDSFLLSAQNFKALLKSYTQDPSVHLSLDDRRLLEERLLGMSRKVTADSAKVKIFRSKLKRYILTGKIGDLDIGNDELRKGLFDKYFKREKSGHESFEKFKKNQTLFWKMKDLVAYIAILAYIKAQAIEPTGTTALSKITDAAFSPTLDPDLYAHWKLKIKEGKPVDRNERGLGEGQYTFVVLENYDIRFFPTVSSAEEGSFLSYTKIRSHRQLAGDQKVLSAGTFHVNGEGRIDRIDGLSGHYDKREKKYIELARMLLNAMGVRGEITIPDDSGLSTKAWIKRGLKKGRNAASAFLFKKSGEEGDKRPEVPEEIKDKTPHY